MVLNQDFQDFEDFLVLGVVWRFESGFSGFRGFFSVGRWYWDDARRSIKLMTIFAYSFRRCDDRSGEIFSQGDLSDINHVKPGTSSVILKILKILIQNNINGKCKKCLKF